MKRSLDVVGRPWLWYAVSAVAALIAVGALWGQGVTMGTAFTGGHEFRVTQSEAGATQDTADAVRDALADADIDGAGSPEVTTTSEGIAVRTGSLDEDASGQVVDTIGEATGATPADISRDEIGASWDSDDTDRVLLGVVVLLVLVLLLVWSYFREWKMALAALVAAVLDVVITGGALALFGLDVTPAAITGLLAVLAFSVYDTVAVFDRVRHHTTGPHRTRMGYAAGAALAVNQSLARSVSTAIVVVVPAAVLLVLGPVSLQGLALVLLVGTGVSIYSSLFLATPLLVHLKRGEKQVKEADRRAASRTRQAARAASYEKPAGGKPTKKSGTAKPKAAAPSGRTAPRPRTTVVQSRSAGRPQPTRKPKSKRGRR